MTLPNNIENHHEPAAESLRSKTAALVSQFLNNEDTTFIKQYSRIIDEYFRESFEKSIVGPRLILKKHPFAIIALGGYGREEQCIHSDIDLLFLFEKRVPEAVEDLIREMVYPLWDLGLDVGHATRTLKECISIAKEDIEVLTSLLDARFVCGMSPLFSKLLDQFRKKIIKRHENKIVAGLIERNRQRHKYFGDSAYLLEANLKEGQGGLRDYHTMLWIARIKSNLKQYRDLEYHGYLSHDEFQSLVESLTFIWNVRNRLHHIAGRKCDQLHFEFQIKMAEALKFKKENGQTPVEIFLSQLHGHMETLKQHYLMLMYELGYSKTSLRRRRKRAADTLIKGLNVTKDGMLNFESPEKILSTPNLLMKIFEESAELKIPLSAEAKRLVKEFDYLVDDHFSSSPPNVKSFERILTASAPTFNALNEMLNAGFLVRFIPEMKDIINRIQYDEYHLYPVDRHSLRAVDIIKKIGTPDDTAKDPLCVDLYKKLKTRTLLLWAALLHDIGKGDAGANHSESGAKMARSILIRKGYKPEYAETVSFLIEHHLLLIKAATRRDILDEETALYCARKIKDVRRLEMLYILTAADSMATGPKAWNDWVSALLRDLFFKVLNILEKGELATLEAVEIVDKKIATIVRSSPDGKAKKKVESLLGIMSPRYLLYTPADKILEHAELYRHMGNAEFVWNVAHPSRSNTRTVTICAHDRPGLFSKIPRTRYSKPSNGSVLKSTCNRHCPANWISPSLYRKKWRPTDPPANIRGVGRIVSWWTMRHPAFLPLSKFSLMTFPACSTASPTRFSGVSSISGWPKLPPKSIRWLMFFMSGILTDKRLIRPITSQPLKRRFKTFCRKSARRKQPNKSRRINFS